LKVSFSFYHFFRSLARRHRDTPFRRVEQLRITGPYRGASGHDHQVRSIVRGLDGLGVKIELPTARVSIYP